MLKGALSILAFKINLYVNRIVIFAFCVYKKIYKQKIAYT